MDGVMNYTYKIMILIHVNARVFYVCIGPLVSVLHGIRPNGKVLNAG